MYPCNEKAFLLEAKTSRGRQSFFEGLGTFFHSSASHITALQSKLEGNKASTLNLIAANLPFCTRQKIELVIASLAKKLKILDAWSNDGDKRTALMVTSGPH